ncbi:hypothetical protein GCM10027164_01590 [Algoriphagus taiwanensis]|uniref:AAA+ ATPase domain-containing protein n=2 Tax=Algoriphagus taiwanensis TaxID=1445656 RepID=A0ABQ6Q117_9BACT|nr:hypothetical protein Ataiwa_20400 [Algoriphagus taiwanensis]
MVKPMKQNAKAIQLELDWLHEILKTRSAINSRPESGPEDLLDIPAPDLGRIDSDYSFLIQKYELGPAERFLIILSAVPHIRPQMLDMFTARNQHTQQIYTEFGVRKGKTGQGILPTGEMVLFILAGKNLEKRFLYQSLFDPQGILFREGIVRISGTEPEESFLNGVLTLSPEILELITTGKAQKPTYGPDFPAQQLKTSMDWEDLVLEEDILLQLKELESWLKHRDYLLEEWEMNRILKPGFKALFHGPPGTGKTLTAALLGKKMGLDVYRIDLSLMISKYIGETEKNLARIFDRAERREWILFFDEADALFGKRTSVNDSHDRYANQEVSYLLQRIEDFSGLVILATNLKTNLDEAFMRRFQSVIYFPVPGFEQRQELWKKAFPKKAALDPEIDLYEIAKKYDLTGGSILNAVRHSLLMALETKEKIVRLEDLREGIRREYQKAGRTI